MSVAAAELVVLWWVETRCVGLDRPVGKVLAMQYRRRIAAATDRKVVVTAEEAYGLGSRQRGEERVSAKVGGGRRRERCRDKRQETRGTSYYYCS